MHCTHDPGTINRTEGAPAANKRFRVGSRQITTTIAFATADPF